tara:strand:- start:400 stop:570 length:171 start_codon:yes stop_codon:yes gene_type:complete
MAKKPKTPKQFSAAIKKLKKEISTLEKAKKGAGKKKKVTKKRKKKAGKKKRKKKRR